MPNQISRIALATGFLGTVHLALQRLIRPEKSIMACSAAVGRFAGRGAFIAATAEAIETPT